MDTATTIRFCDLIIGLANLVEFLAFALPIAGLLAIGLIVTSRYVNHRLTAARHAPAQNPARLRASRLSQFAKAPPHTQPKPDTALIVSA